MCGRQCLPIIARMMPTSPTYLWTPYVHYRYQYQASIDVGLLCHISCAEFISNSICADDEWQTRASVGRGAWQITPHYFIFPVYLSPKMMCPNTCYYNSRNSHGQEYPKPRDSVPSTTLLNHLAPKALQCFKTGATFQAIKYYRKFSYALSLSI